MNYATLLSLVAALGGFLFGYDTAVINGANQYLKVHFGLSATQEGLAGASAILGCIPGAIAAGPLSDRFGRRKMLFVCAVLYAISGVMSAIPRSFGGFLGARVISGLGIGASSMICPVYIAEIAPAGRRGRLGTLFQLGIVVGIFLTLFFNLAIQRLGDAAWNTAIGWRWMLGLEIVPAVAFLAGLTVVPESPRWLVGAGRESEAHAVLLKTAGTAEADREIGDIRTALRTEKDGFAGLLHRQFRRPLLIAVVVMAVSQFCGINAIIYYSTRIFANAGLGTSGSFGSSAIMGLVNLLFTLVAIGLVDRVGRRPLLMTGLAIQSAALLAIGWMFHGGRAGSGLLAAVLVFTAAFAMALGPISWLLCSEIFPTKARGRAMSIAAFTVWASCYIVAQTFPMLNDSPAVGPAMTFGAYGAVSIAGFLFVLAFVPETKGQTLEEIEARWNASAPSGIHGGRPVLE